VILAQGSNGWSSASLILHSSPRPPLHYCSILCVAAMEKTDEKNVMPTQPEAERGVSSMSVCGTVSSMSSCGNKPFLPPPRPRGLTACTIDKIKVPTLESPDAFTRVVEGQIPDELRSALQLDFTESEIFEIAHHCDAYVAQQNNSKPIALWIFGPPAVGKTTITNEKARDLFGQADNAVTIDGDIFRAVHKGFLMVALHGLRNNWIHKEAWEILKKTGHMDRIKEGIVDHAVQHRQNLKIPEAAANTKRIQGMLERLEAAGYGMHAIFLWAPKSVTEGRGRPRSVKAGKVFSSKHYQAFTKSTFQFGCHWQTQIEKGNVHYKTVAYYDNTTFPSRLVNAAEFEQLTNMTDEEANEHARICEIAKHVRDMSEKALTEARAKGVAPRQVMLAGAQAWTVASGKLLHRDQESKESCPTSSSDVDRVSRFPCDPALFLAESQRGRREGFLAGIICSISVVALFSCLLRQNGS